jgi:AraC-like DNA-binding protein
VASRCGLYAPGAHEIQDPDSRYGLGVPSLEPHLTSRAIRPLVSGLRALGHDPAPILRAFEISESTVDDPDARIPMRSVIELLVRTAESTGDADLGLHLAERAELGSFDVQFYAMLSSPTLGDAYRRLSRYQRLIHETTRIELEVEGPRAELRHIMPGGTVVPRHSAEFLVTAWVRVGRVVTDTDWAPTEIRFAHPAPPDIREHERFFRAPVHFSMGQNCLAMPASLLETPCAHTDPGLLAVLDRYALDRLDRAPRSSSLADRVRSALAESLDGGEIQASRVGSRLKMSARTLHRALASEGTSFGEILETLRKELAARRLADERVSIGEIAFLLGFSELSSFHRAFKRWTGRTPAEFRSELRSSPR